MSFWKATWSAIVAGLVVLYFPKLLDWIGLLPQKLDFLLEWSQWVWQKVTVTVPVPAAFIGILGAMVGKLLKDNQRLRPMLREAFLLKPRDFEASQMPSTAAAPVPGLDKFIEVATKPAEIPATAPSAVEAEKEYPLTDEEDRVMFMLSSTSNADAKVVFDGVGLSQLRFEHAVEGLKRQGYLKEHFTYKARLLSLTHAGRQLVIDHDIDKIPF